MTARYTIKTGCTEPDAPSGDLIGAHDFIQDAIVCDQLTKTNASSVPGNSDGDMQKK
jgi:hypothetical protein